MEQQHGERFRPLDGIRGVAILMVLALHSFDYTGTSVFGRAIETVTRAGWMGVTLFFVLSGFLITGILIDTRDRPHALRDFYARRALRIFPLYFAFLALYLFVAPHLSYASERLAQPPTGVYYWTYLANMQESLSGIANTASPLGPLWSLAVEEQIYLVWPFVILRVARRRLPMVWIALACCSFAFRVWTRATAQSIEMSYAWSPSNVEAFAAGALVAWSVRDLRTVLTRWARPAALIAAAVIAALWLRLGHFNFWSSPVEILTIGTTAAVVLFASTIGISVTAGRTSSVNRIFAASWLRVFGKYSYAIYLVHVPVIELLRPLHHGLGAALFTAGVTACSLATAFVSWHLWEAPFLSLKRYFPSSGRLVAVDPEIPAAPAVTSVSVDRRVA